jgi:hypothetical protein
MAYPNETADRTQSAQDYFSRHAGVTGSLNAVKETPYSRLAGAVERLRKAGSVVGSVAGKLCGDQPEEARDRHTRGPIGGGMLGSIEELADSISDMADDIAEAATRIDRRL